MRKTIALLFVILLSLSLFASDPVTVEVSGTVEAGYLPPGYPTKVDDDDPVIEDPVTGIGVAIRVVTDTNEAGPTISAWPETHENFTNGTATITGVDLMHDDEGTGETNNKDSLGIAFAAYGNIVSAGASSTIKVYSDGWTAAGGAATIPTLTIDCLGVTSNSFTTDPVAVATNDATVPDTLKIAAKNAGAVTAAELVGYAKVTWDYDGVLSPDTYSADIKIEFTTGV